MHGVSASAQQSGDASPLSRARRHTARARAAAASAAATHGLAFTCQPGSSIMSAPPSASFSTRRSTPSASTAYDSASAVAVSAAAARGAAVPEPRAAEARPSPCAPACAPARSRSRSEGRLVAGAESRKAKARPGAPPAFWMSAA